MTRSRSGVRVCCVGGWGAVVAVVVVVVVVFREKRRAESSRARTAMDRSIVTLQSSTLEHSGVESALGPSGPKRSFCLK